MNIKNIIPSTKLSKVNSSTKEITFFEMDPKKKIEKITSLIKVLIKNWLIKKINDLEINKINPVQIEYHILESIQKWDITQKKIENHISELANKWHITQEEYVNFSLEAWTIMILEFLKYENLMSSVEDKIIQITQKNRKNEGINDKVLSILIEKNLIKNKDKLYNALIKFGLKIKSWESLVLKGYITYEQLILAIKIQNKQKEDKNNWYINIVDKLWEILINEKFITQKKLNDGLNELWIDIEDFFELKDELWYIPKFKKWPWEWIYSK